jgi:hypothetical protein
VRHINSILNDVAGSLNLDGRLKEHAIMDIWPTLVGEPMAARTRVRLIDKQRNLVVSVKDAATGQELSLLKPAIMNKLVSAADSAGVVLKGLRFDLKHFHSDGSK